jgi:hypothetical protein
VSNEPARDLPRPDDHRVAVIATENERTDVMASRLGLRARVPREVHQRQARVVMVSEGTDWIDIFGVADLARGARRALR